MKKEKFTGITSFALHLIAMAFMLCDHLWATVIPGNMWLTDIGRMAFPIFAFMIVEGYFHTADIRKYLLRLAAGALLSEIPFDLMYGGTWFYPYHQNVMWTFLLALLCIMAAEKVKEKHPKLWIPVSLLIFLTGTILGFACMVDYYGFGLLTVAVFYYTAGRCRSNCGSGAPGRDSAGNPPGGRTDWSSTAKCLLRHGLQFAGLWWINVTLMGGQVMDVTLFGHTFEIMQQGLALLALIPIWLYDGRQGPHSKGIQAAFYLFYPAHMLILSLIALNM